MAEGKGVRLSNLVRDQATITIPVPDDDSPDAVEVVYRPSQLKAEHAEQLLTLPDEEGIYYLGRYLFGDPDDGDDGDDGDDDGDKLPGVIVSWDILDDETGEPLPIEPRTIYRLPLPFVRRLQLKLGGDGVPEARRGRSRPRS